MIKSRQKRLASVSQYSMDYPQATEIADINPNPKPSALRTTSSTKRPAFGSTGKSLSFEEQICTVIPNDSFYENDSEEDEDKKRKCKSCGSWWDPEAERNWVGYVSQTSIHGLKYIGESRRHIFERLFWILAFAVSCFAATYLIKSVWQKYTESPVVVTFQPFETFVKQIPFPAITICNMNKVLRSKAEEFMKAATGPEDAPETMEAWKNVYYLDHVCSSSNKPFSTVFNYTSTQGTVKPDILTIASNKIKPNENDVEDVAEFLQKASQPCSDMLQLCMWQGEMFNCSKLFRPIETDFGKCCSFNIVPQSLLHRYTNDSRDSPLAIKDWSSVDLAIDNLILPSDTPTGTSSSQGKYPFRQNHAGKGSGLAILLDPDLDQYWCTSSDSTGFRLASHLSTDYPLVSDFGLAIRPNYEHFVSVRPELTVADDIIMDIPIDKRKCYMDGEMYLKYFAYYTGSNCVEECVANRTYTECGCVRYYMPRDEKRSICGPSKFDCAEKVRKESVVSGVKNICPNCLPTCTEIRYHADVSSTPFRRRVDLWRDEFNKSTSWAGNNISIVHVYFGQESTYARVRSQLYGLTDLIANFGGLMGLCMGFSGLSLIEFFYFFTIRVFFREKRKRMLIRQQERREAVQRDREKALSYSGVGLTRRLSIDSERSNGNISDLCSNLRLPNKDNGDGKGDLRDEREMDRGYSSVTPTKGIREDEERL